MTVLLATVLLWGGNIMTEHALAGARITQVALTTKDLAAAREFYESKMGLPLTISTDTMLFFDGGGVALMLSLPEEAAPFSSAGAVVYFEVKDIEGRWKLLRDRDVELEGQPHVVHRAGTRELWMGFFRDPDGHLLALTEWR
jgi:methylmalonyl-CoA/ethylmalonyl-CoA epimerase